MPFTPAIAEDVELPSVLASIPSVFVDENLLKASSKPFLNQLTYKVNGAVFTEDCQTENKYKEFKEFKLHAGRKRLKVTMDEYDMYCSTPTDSGSDYDEDHDVATSESVLKVELSAVQNGFIVNNSCFLTWQQWNTLVTSAASAELFHCMVCSLYCEPSAAQSHVATANHRAALSHFPPLERMELSVTRKVRNEYHCGVCNEAFDIQDECIHYSGKMHEGNLLFAINKASDLLDNYGYNNPHTDNKIDTFHFKNNHINDNESVSGSVSSDHTNDNLRYVNFQNGFFYDDFDESFAEPVFTGVSYANMAKKPKAVTQGFLEIDLGNKQVKVSFNSWHMIISPKPNRFWCMACKTLDHIRKKQEHCARTDHLEHLNRCHVVHSYVDYFIRQVDDKLYHCGHCNQLQLIHEMDDHIESNHKKNTKLVTEAKSTNSPVKNAQTPVKNSQAPVKNSQTQVIYSQTLVKNSQTQVTNGQTQVKTENAKNLAKDINGANNLTKLSENVNNNLSGSPLYYSNSKNVESLNLDINSNNSVNNPTVNFHIKNEGTQKNIETSPNNVLTHKLPGILDTTVIYPFGYKMTIPSLAYNIVCKRPNDYYCGLCDSICDDNNISLHVYDLKHLMLLQRTPFIAPFSYHLIRAIREALHCAICNMPVAAASIYNHIKDPKHVELLNKALNDKPPQTNQITNLPNAPEVNVDLKGVPTISANLGGQSEKPSNLQDTKSNVKFGEHKQSKDDLGVPNNLAPNSNVNQRFERYQREAKVSEKSVEDDIDETEEEYENSEEDLEDIDRTFDSTDEVYFDLEEYVYLKLKNNYIKVTNTSYNTLVNIGDGSKHCFVCSTQVQYIDLQKHVDSRQHLENLEKYRFLDKYEDHLLRQIYLMYHCAICNVIISRKELKNHIEWPTHVLQIENTSKNIKKTRKHDIKSGIKQIVVFTQKENIYLHEKETKIKISLHANVVQSEKDRSLNSRKNKIIIFNDNVLKFPWEHWNGVVRVKNGFKCTLCQREVKTSEVDIHCATEWHKYSLDKPFEKQYAPALLRKINEATLNCVICNTEMSTRDALVQEHINGKRHAKNHDHILKESSQSNCYTDCEADVLML